MKPCTCLDSRSGCVQSRYQLRKCLDLLMTLGRQITPKERTAFQVLMQPGAQEARAGNGDRLLQLM